MTENLSVVMSYPRASSSCRNVLPSSGKITVRSKASSSKQAALPSDSFAGPPVVSGAAEKLALVAATKDNHGQHMQN